MVAPARNTGEQLHLTPIAGIYQMRPSFAHIDAQDEAEKKSAEEKDGKIKTEEEVERAVEVSARLQAWRAFTLADR